MADSAISFQNIDTINDVFSNILKNDTTFDKLGIDCIDAVKKIEWYNPYKNIKGTRALDKNWNTFIKIFKTRQILITEMTKLKFTDIQIFSFCDNSINFLESMIFLCIKDYRNEVISILNSKYTMRQAIKGLP